MEEEEELLLLDGALLLLDEELLLELDELGVEEEEDVVALDALLDKTLINCKSSSSSIVSARATKVAQAKYFAKRIFS